MKLSGTLRLFRPDCRTLLRLNTSSGVVTHSSMSTPNRDDNHGSNFRGDRVLVWSCQEALVAGMRLPLKACWPHFNALVRKETCADVARQIDLWCSVETWSTEMLTGAAQGRLADAMWKRWIAAVWYRCRI
jgi:ribonuclease-3